MAEPDIPEDVKAKIRNLTFDAPVLYDDSMTDRRATTSSPVHLCICIESGNAHGDWDGEITDLDKPTEHMAQQIKWAWNDIVNSPQMKGRITVEYVTDSGDADISYFSAVPYPSKEGWAGVTGGYKNAKGQVCKEVLLNPHPYYSEKSQVLYAAWVNKDSATQADKKDSQYNPLNPYGQAARIVKHETGHALGLRHWGDNGQQDTREAGRSSDVDTDTTLMAYRVGQNTKMDFRKLDLQALEYLYDSKQQQVAKSQDSGVFPFSLFTKDTGRQR